LKSDVSILVLSLSTSVSEAECFCASVEKTAGKSEEFTYDSNFTGLYSRSQSIGDLGIAWSLLLVP